VRKSRNPTTDTNTEYIAPKKEKPEGQQLRLNQTQYAGMQARGTASASSSQQQFRLQGSLILRMVDVPCLTVYTEQSRRPS
jgi:hypothetical protein